MFDALVLVTLLLFVAMRRGGGTGGCCWCSGGWLRVRVPALTAFEELPLIEFVANMIAHW